MIVYQQKLFSDNEIYGYSEEVSKFIKWLKEQGIYEKFKYNMENITGNYNSFEELNNSIIAVNDLIRGAFIWSYSDEHTEFWHRYSEKWEGLNDTY